ncbi:unnamed protein product, partial [Brugia timori]|uniref:Secreted protein n=1 Tax=Brugia timori TaxID=42155 RepID=A0A0R3QG04_9BILA
IFAASVAPHKFGGIHFSVVDNNRCKSVPPIPNLQSLPAITFPDEQTESSVRVVSSSTASPVSALMITGSCIVLGRFFGKAGLRLHDDLETLLSALLTNGCRRSRRLFDDIFLQLKAVLVLASISDVSVTKVSALALLSPPSCRLQAVT